MSSSNISQGSLFNSTTRPAANTSSGASAFDRLILYLVPVLCLIAVINNVTILAVTFLNTPFRKEIFVSVRLQYGALAVADICIVLIFHLIEWLGMAFKQK